MVSYIHDSTTLWRIWDPPLGVLRSQSDVIFDKRAMPTHHVYTRQTDIFELPEETEYVEEIETGGDGLLHKYAATSQQVKATEVVIMTVLTMIQTKFCLMLTIVEVSCKYSCEITSS